MATIPETLAIGWTFHQAGDLPRAAQTYRQVLESDPGFAQAWCLLGAVNQVMGKLDESVANYQEALRLAPDLAEARNNLGLALYNQGMTDEALASYREALRLKPDYPDAHNNLGNALQSQGALDEAAACYRRALAIDRAHADAHHNLGNTLRALGLLDEALLSYERALWIRPDQAQFHLSRALLWLHMGDFQRGWPEFEWRWKCPEYSLPPFRQPIWDGTPLNGRTLLLFADHGMGDTIQFIRYAPIVKQRGGRVIVACRRPLARILTTAPGIDHVVAEGDPLPEFDVYAPVMSLPRILGLTQSPAIPYLAADPKLVEHWKRELGPLPELKIGLAWQGNPSYRKDRQRSFNLAQLAPIARVPGVRLYSLQRAPGSAQIPEVAESFQVTDLGTHLGDFMDDAAVMANLDLVISAETSLAHLGGALGIPVWVALSFNPDWHWPADRPESTWYPTLRLFRQKSWGNWDEVFERMAGELSKK